MRNVLCRFVAADDGATAIEYGLIAAIVGLGIVASLKTLATALSNTFSSVGANLN